MLTTALLLLGIAQCHGDIRVTNANLYMDSLFLNEMPKAVASSGLEPIHTVPLSVSVNPPKLGASRAVMPASTWNFTSTVVSGLSTGVGRSQNCSRPAIRNGNITVTCEVSFKGVQISLDGFMSWADSKGTVAPARTVALFAKSSAIVVTAGPQRYRPGSLIKFEVVDLKFSLVPNYEPLAKELKNELRSRVKKLLETDYRSVLESAVGRVDLPAV